jgi:uncharacterized double-CXXCG motif protein
MTDLRYFEVCEPPSDAPSPWTGEYSAEHRWALPGIECTTCGATWGGMLAYPGVDLSDLPERKSFEAPWPKPPIEYARLAELVRPLLPSGAPLEPGCAFGPLRGTARGRFGPVTACPSWQLLVREDALARLQEAGLRGVVPIRAQLKTRQSDAPALYELQVPPGGRLHEDCLPSRGPPCPTCGRDEFSLPKERWLDAPSLSKDLDVFRIINTARFVVTERFAEVVRGLGPSDIAFKPLPTDGPGEGAGTPPRH